jgi:hypothetical protein
VPFVAKTRMQMHRENEIAFLSPCGRGMQRASREQKMRKQQCLQHAAATNRMNVPTHRNG